MSRIFTVALMFVCVTLAAGCKDDATTNTTSGSGGGGGGSAAAAGGPTKEAAVKTLQDAAAAFDAKDYDKALTYFQVPPGKTPDQFKEAAPALVESREISKQGVEILAAKGKWGKLNDVFEDRAQGYAERAGVPVDQCYGLAHENAEAGFHWNGQQFKIIRCDDVGKLTQ